MNHNRKICIKSLLKGTKEVVQLLQVIEILMNGQVFLVNPLLGTAALDRLVHKGIQVIIEGSSFRLAEFKKTSMKSKKV